MNEYGTTLRALATALLEIRATKSLLGAQVLADVFHKVPIMIANGKSEQEIMADVLDIASRHDCRKQIASFLNQQP